MSTDLIPLPTFEGKEIRAIEHQGEVWIPIRDLGAAWGLHRTTLYQHVTRNKDDFEGFAKVGDILSQGLPGEIYINEPGLYMLIGRLSKAQIKNPAAKEMIIRFRKSAPKILQGARKGEIHQEQQLDEVVAYDLIEAKQIAKLTDTDPKAMQAAILRKHGYPEIADVLRPAITHGESGWYNTTRLIALCNDPDLTAERLNWYLKNKGFQYRDGYIWRLTPDGLIHGREYNFEAPSGHVEIRIAWRESVLFASGLKRQISNDQTAFTAKAGS